MQEVPLPGGATAWGLALAVTGVALVVTAVVRARPPTAPPPGTTAFFAAWQRVHGGYDPRTGSSWLRGWLRVVHRVAQPVARKGVAPDLLTAWALWLAAAAAVTAANGGRWPLLAGALVALSGLADALDGAVALLTDRATRWGYVLDSVADRLSELLFLTALVSAGAPAALAVGCGAGFLLLEYVRARAGNAGGDEVGVVTVGERANRVIVVALGLVGAGALAGRAAVVATVAAGVLAGLTGGGLVQLLVAVRRDLSAPDR